MAISISVTVGETMASTSVNATGSDYGLLSDPESVYLFEGPGNLGNILAQHFGWPPARWFLRDPCNEGQNWYATYGWQPVTRTRQVISATVQSVSVTPQIASTQICDNSQGTQPLEFMPSLSSTVTNSVSSTSSITETLGITQEISYDISFLGTGGGGTTALSYSQSWEDSYTKTAEESFAVSASVSVPVPAGETATAELMLSQGTLVIEVEYQVTVAGMVTAGFDNPYNGHYIWAVEVNGLLTGAVPPIPNVVTSTETLTIDFYANASIVVRSSDGGIQPLDSRHATAAPDSRFIVNAEMPFPADLALA